MTPDEVHKLVAWTPLHRAAFRGDVESATKLVGDGHDVDARAIDAWTPLMCACLEGHVQVARLLLARRAKAAVPGVRLASIACASGDLDTTRVFLPQIVSERDAALFFLAAHARAGHTMTKLTDEGQSDGDMTGYSMLWMESWEIHAAALALDAEVMDYLGAHVAPLADGELRVGDVAFSVANAPPASTPTSTSASGSTSTSTPASMVTRLCGGYVREAYAADLASHWLGDRVLPVSRLRSLLMKAIRLLHVDVVDALLPETGKSRALFVAIASDDPALIARFIDESDLDETEDEGHSPRLTALGVAAHHAKPRAASLLLERGAHVERGGGPQSPLLLAVEKIGPAALDVVIALLEHGAKLEVTHSVKGWTPLMRAALMGDAKIVERLLRAGANANARDKHGMTPLAHAKVGESINRRQDHREIVELLLGFGAKAEQ